jgi:hypothetical protein
MVSSCATIKINYLQNYDDASLQSISFAPADIKLYLDKIESLRRKTKNRDGELTETEYEEIIRELAPLVEEYKRYSAYVAAAGKDKGAIIIPPKTKLTLRLNTYCLTPHKAVPSENEPFILTKSVPDIPLYREIMTYTNTQERVSQSLKQELLWNLKNKVNFEDLPSEQRELLLRADSAAALKINSRLKKSIMRKIVDFLGGIFPAIGKAEEKLVIMEGRAHTFQNYAGRLAALKSKMKSCLTINP